MSDPTTDQHDVPGQDPVQPLDPDERFAALVVDILATMRRYGYTAVDDRARGRAVSAILGLADILDGRGRR